MRNEAEGGGASRITEDITKIVAQLPPMVESLTGLKLDDLLSRIPKIAERKKEGEEKAEEPPVYQRKRVKIMLEWELLV